MCRSSSVVDSGCYGCSGPVHGRSSSDLRRRYRSSALQGQRRSHAPRTPSGPNENDLREDSHDAAHPQPSCTSTIARWPLDSPSRSSQAPRCRARSAELVENCQIDCNVGNLGGAEHYEIGTPRQSAAGIQRTPASQLDSPIIPDWDGWWGIEVRGNVPPSSSFFGRNDLGEMDQEGVNNPGYGSCSFERSSSSGPRILKSYEDDGHRGLESPERVQTHSDAPPDHRKAVKKRRDDERPATPAPVGALGKRGLTAIARANLPA